MRCAGQPTRRFCIDFFLFSSSLRRRSCLAFFLSCLALRSLVLRSTNCSQPKANAWPMKGTS